MLPADAGRRRILTAAGGALLLAAMRRSIATPAFEVPVVDSLTLHVVVDAATTVAGERIERPGLLVPPRLA